MKKKEKLIKNKTPNKSLTKTLGIIGGGQLGRMICFAAHSMGFNTVVFSDQKNSPASFVTNKTIVASYSNKTALKKFASLVDFATFEFENIPLQTAQIVAENVALYPKPLVLEITQNRILEKKFLNSIGIKTAQYQEITSLEDLKQNLKKFGKSILKTATMGYDGKGQFVLKNVADATKIWPKVAKQKLILEKFCPFNSETSVVVARSLDSEIVAYEPLTNIHKNGILDESIYPASISLTLKNKACELAKKIAQEIDLVGVMAVEFFVCENELIVNELAPRPHNSGHFFTDAALTSQFEQLVRAISGMKLGSTKIHHSGYMKNLIGDDVKKAGDLFQNPYQKNLQAKVHLYGKTESKEGRKMGHVNWLKIK